LIQGTAVQVPAGETYRGFRSIGVVKLSGGAVVERWVNEGARQIVVVDELRAKHGASIPPGAIVLIEPGADTTQEEVAHAAEQAGLLGAAKVAVLPARVRGVGEKAALPMIDHEADPTVREAVEIALQRVPEDVREGARRRTDLFLSQEKL